MASRDDVAGEACVALGTGERRFDAYPTRELHLGELAIRRALPQFCWSSSRATLSKWTPIMNA